MNHEELCELGARLLRRDYDCAVVLTDCRSQWPGGHEIPDVIGWRTSGSQESAVLEIKTSISDYRADLKKPHRASVTRGCGNRRLYLMPETLARQVVVRHDFPSWWGMIAEREGELLEIRESKHFPRGERALREENRLLVLAYRKLQGEHNSVLSHRTSGEPRDRAQWLDMVRRVVREHWMEWEAPIFASDVLVQCGLGGERSRLKAMGVIRDAVQSGRLAGIDYGQRDGKTVLTWKGEDHD